MNKEAKWLVHGHQTPFWKKKNFQIAALLVALLIAAAAAWYIIFYQAAGCNTIGCFQEHMKSCSRATYVNEEPEASWGYSIQGSSGSTCTVKVTLLNAKTGELGIENLVGEDMLCNDLKGSITYPEKDLATCHGLLKEDLQQIIINKLHSYIIENLGQIGQGLATV